jgi:hypothetical protein
MEFEASSGYVPATDFQDGVDISLPIFNVERVQLQFPRPSDFVAAQVANNAIILAFTTGRILRIGTVYMPVHLAFANQVP